MLTEQDIATPVARGVAVVATQHVAKIERAVAAARRANPPPRRAFPAGRSSAFYAHAYNGVINHIYGFMNLLKEQEYFQS